MDNSASLDLGPQFVDAGRGERMGNNEMPWRSGIRKRVDVEELFHVAPDANDVHGLLVLNLDVFGGDRRVRGLLVHEKIKPRRSADRRGLRSAHIHREPLTDIR